MFYYRMTMTGIFSVPSSITKELSSLSFRADRSSRLQEGPPPGLSNKLPSYRLSFCKYHVYEEKKRQKTNGILLQDSFLFVLENNFSEIPNNVENDGWIISTQWKFILSGQHLRIWLFLPVLRRKERNGQQQSNNCLIQGLNIWLKTDTNLWCWIKERNIRVRKNLRLRIYW